MTTTTEERTTTAQDDLLAAAAQAAEELGAKTLATIQPEQQRWNDNQIAILRALGIEDATQADLDLFFHYCRTTGLDPFRRQIYMIGRNTKITEWVDQPSGGRTRVEKYVTKYTIQTGIDGYRRNGREAAKRLGDTLSFDGPYWCGEDGVWKEVWPGQTPPVAAKYTVFRNGEPFSAVVHYDEFVQTNAVYEGSGNQRRKIRDEPNSMWAKMPRNQTAKCAEAMAYRRAYPDDFTGLILEDSAQPTVIDQDGNVEAPAAKPTRKGGRGVGGLRDKARAATREEPIEGEVVADPGQGDGNEQSQGAESSSGPVPRPDSADQDTAAPKPEKNGMRKAVEKRTFTLLGEVRLGEQGTKLSRDDRIDLYRELLGRPEVGSTDDLDNVEVSKVGDQLYQWQQAGVLNDKVRDVLMAADAKAVEEN